MSWQPLNVPCREARRRCPFVPRLFPKRKSSHDSDNLFHGSLRDSEPLKADLTLLADVVAFCVTPSREPTETNQKALTGTGGQQLRSRKCMLTGLTGPVVLGFCVTAWHNTIVSTTAKHDPRKILRHYIGLMTCIYIVFQHSQYLTSQSFVFAYLYLIYLTFI